MEKAYKYRIYPNKRQKELLTKTFGCCRFVYNHFLNKRIETYQTEQKTLTYYKGFVCKRMDMSELSHNIRQRWKCSKEHTE